MKSTFPSASQCAFLAALALAPSPGRAQTAPPPAVGPSGPAADANPTGWTAKAGLSYVQTSGNSETSTLGFKFNAVYNWTRTFFTLQGGGVRSDTTFKTTFGVGSVDDYLIVEQERNEKTAANYFLDASLDRNVTKKFFWQTGAGYLRNTFAGVDNRLAGRAGVGYILTDPASKGAQFKTAGFVTLTHQDEVVEDPDTDDTFIGLRIMADLAVPFGQSSFNSRVNLDENLQSTDDLRLTWWNSLGVALNDRLALQLSLLLYYDNLPALQPIEIFADQSQGLPLGPPIGSGFARFGKWDSEFAVSLVINLAPKKPAPDPAGKP